MTSACWDDGEEKGRLEQGLSKGEKCSTSRIPRDHVQIGERIHNNMSILFRNVELIQKEAIIKF